MLHSDDAVWPLDQRPSLPANVLNLAQEARLAVDRHFALVDQEADARDVLSTHQAANNAMIAFLTSMLCAATFPDARCIDQHPLGQFILVYGVHLTKARNAHLPMGGQLSEPAAMLLHLARSLIIKACVERSLDESLPPLSELA